MVYAELPESKSFDGAEDYNFKLPRPFFDWRHNYLQPLHPSRISSYTARRDLQRSLAFCRGP